MPHYVYFINRDGVVYETIVKSKVPAQRILGPMGCLYEIVGFKVKGFNGDIESVTYREV